MPVASPPIAHGAVLVGDDGRIAAVGPDHVVPRPPTAETLDLPQCVVTPGLVNTHTHLELTGLAGQVEEELFLDWIRRLIALKAGRSPGQFHEAALAGIRQCWHGGVTTICDTGSTGAVIAALDELGGSGAVHHEVFGMHPDERDGAIRAFSRDLDRLAVHATGRVTLGLSPHAPYTVSGPLYRATAELARAHGAPMAVHVAEPADESALLRDFTGSFAGWWTERGIPRPAADAVSPVAWLERHGVLGERTLCVHAIHADAADVALMARHQCAVAHCPRSNRRHHQADAPVADYRAAGLRIGLGTDSEVSVAPIDLVEEARVARARNGWTAVETVAMLTAGGAAAIGMAGAVGELVAGQWGDMVAWRAADSGPPEEAVLRAGTAAVCATWLAGRAVRPLVSPHRP